MLINLNECIVCSRDFRCEAQCFSQKSSVKNSEDKTVFILRGIVVQQLQYKLGESAYVKYQ